MGADKPDVDHAIGIIDPHYDPVLVARDIEDRATVFENTGAADISLYVRRFCPIRLSHLPKPGHNRFIGVSHAFAALEKSLDSAECYHPHDANSIS